MIIVGRLIQGEKASLFVSDEVFEFIMSYEYTDKNNVQANKAMKKLKYFADGGFVVDRGNIRSEGDEVFRIEIENTGRIIGFFDKKDFIGISSYEKKSKKLNRMQRTVLKKVKKIYVDHDWIKSISK
ncbi:MAG: hypothetical protein A2X59_13410 [Nitrospirae bacterium GWC2_42_7]|nr:MAG: hypothetical protein A2X59_13410 [Nitrospirae bacterium GWC2_42_7]